MAKKRKAIKQERRISASGIFMGTLRFISIAFSILTSLLFIVILFGLLGLFIGDATIETGNVAVIPISGIITTNGEASALRSPLGTSSTRITKFIEKAIDNDDIKAILLEIDSPGGTPVATDEVAQAVKDANKTVVAVIRESGASGAFWIATAADYVYANRMSVTGSIGVKGSYLEFSGLLSDYNVTYQQLTAGEFKELRSPFKAMDNEERAIYQDILDTLHEEFIDAVAENRDLPRATVQELATGTVYLGKQAKELGLVDALGTKEDALEYIEEQMNISAEIVTYKHKGGLFDVLASASADSYYQIGRGIGSSMNTEVQPSFT